MASSVADQYWPSLLAIDPAVTLSYLQQNCAIVWLLLKVQFGSTGVKRPEWLKPLMDTFSMKKTVDRLLNPVNGRLARTIPLAATLSKQAPKVE